MREVVEVVGWFAALFAASLAVSWILTTLAVSRRRRVEVPQNSLVRLRADGAMYRSRLLKVERGGWLLAAPLQRDAHVPLRVGERLTVDCTTPKGLFRFRSEIVERDSCEHTIRLAPPAQAFLIERRQGQRVAFDLPEMVFVEGMEGELLDVSELGAKVSLRARLSRGERVRVEGPRFPRPTFAWVMETFPSTSRGGQGILARLRFEESVPIEAFRRLRSVYRS